MFENLEPISTKSLKETFIEYFEQLILSGEFAINQKLPSERDLAQKLQVSRPVVHEGLLELASKGLVRIVPRRGVFVNDYRKEGSISILESLLNYKDFNLDPTIFNSFLEIRIILETQLAEKAATNRSEQDLIILENILKKENENNFTNEEEIAGLDFDFHHAIAISSGNIVAPLLINSFKNIYIAILQKFYKESDVLTKIFELHRILYTSIKEQDSKRAAKTMSEILDFGESTLRKILNIKN